jgi:hypothetical protein
VVNMRDDRDVAQVAALPYRHAATLDSVLDSNIWACPAVPARRERWSDGGWQASHCRTCRVPAKSRSDFMGWRQRSQALIRATRSRAWDCGTGPSLWGAATATERVADTASPVRGWPTLRSVGSRCGTSATATQRSAQAPAP